MDETLRNLFIFSLILNIYIIAFKSNIKDKLINNRTKNKRLLKK